MSRIGKKPITIPKGVTVTIKERELEVKGPKGVQKTPIPQGIWDSSASWHGIPAPSARAPTAFSIGVGPQAKISRGAPPASAKIGSRIRVTNPFVPALPSSVARRTGTRFLRKNSRATRSPRERAP